MKSTTNRLKAIIGILVCMQSYGHLQAQCSQKVEVSNVVTDDRKTQASFDVKVIANEVYNGQILKIDGTRQSVFKSFSGSGERSFSFEDLAPGNDMFYRVVIEYAREEKFLCKRRVTDIAITDTK